MAEPRVPGSEGADIELPCGETVALHDLDMGLREYDCACGEAHAVVMDVHPLGRFVPEFLVEVLTETVETADEFPEFTTAHVMGIVMEEFPEAVVSEDLSDQGEVGYSLLWLTDFDARRLHEIVVELVVELMDHAVSHADDEAAAAQFEEWLHEFDVSAFVDQYREEREFETEHDSAV
ncbi:DUF5815 family protein [Halosimplex halophilum]|uniref:DUF5815 family protein n=1 Tax=Halosimplex halophilum TaxID=2559572 RepID=UPI00107F7B2E|nr:DUF5815 family protein [Halosimplex halophilum]